MRLRCKGCDQCYSGSSPSEIQVAAFRRCNRQDCGISDPASSRKGGTLLDFNELTKIQNSGLSKRQQRKEKALLLQQRMRKFQEPPEDQVFIEFDEPMERHLYC